MASATSPTAQHFIECEYCARNPAQFQCKTCPGYLCDTCKTEHETKKIFKNHVVIHLHGNKDETLCVIYCEKHTSNILEWFCSLCKEPVCAKCHMEFHNGHRMKELDRVYNDLRMKRKKEKEKIERELLPNLIERLNGKKTTKAEISKKIYEAQKDIEDRINPILEDLTMKKNNAIKKLHEEEKKANEAIEEVERDIERRIDALEKIKESITNELAANPGIAFFKTTDFNLYKYVQGIPSVTYNPESLQPDEIFNTKL